MSTPTQAADALRPRSLRWRLLAATVLALALALLLAGLVLRALFAAHVRDQYIQTLTAQLDQITAQLDLSDARAPRRPAAGLSDPRWQRPLSGLYWQIEPLPGGPRFTPLRSRSLWDQSLQVPADTPPDGAVHVHEVLGNQGEALLVVERSVRAPAEGDAGAAVRLWVAGDLAALEASQQRFTGVLAASLAALFALLGAAALAQVHVGLAPLRALGSALRRVRAGQEAQLQGRFPAEVQPLVDDFNGVLQREAERVARAKTQAGNLAHAVKTPLAVLQQIADQAQSAPGEHAPPDWPLQVSAQVALARRHIDWHLTRARATAAQGTPGLATPLGPVVAGLLRAMRILHAERGLHFEDVSGAQAANVCFAGEAQDLQEMLGNLLDNAGKWARTQVLLRLLATPVGEHGDVLELAVDDDGPGIAPDQRATALHRGSRLDETVPGSGLGLAIAQELAQLYGGALLLEDSPLGGLRAVLRLPAVPNPAGV